MSEEFDPNEPMVEEPAEEVQQDGIYEAEGYADEPEESDEDESYDAEDPQPFPAEEEAAPPPPPQAPPQDPRTPGGMRALISEQRQQMAMLQQQLAQMNRRFEPFAQAMMTARQQQMQEAMRREQEARANEDPVAKLDRIEKTLAEKDQNERASKQMQAVIASNEQIVAQFVQEANAPWYPQAVEYLVATAMEEERLANPNVDPATIQRNIAAKALEITQRLGPRFPMHLAKMAIARGFRPPGFAQPVQQQAQPRQQQQPAPGRDPRQQVAETQRRQKSARTITGLEGAAPRRNVDFAKLSDEEFDIAFREAGGMKGILRAMGKGTRGAGGG